MFIYLYIFCYSKISGSIPHHTSTPTQYSNQIYTHDYTVHTNTRTIMLYAGYTTARYTPE